MLNEKFDRILAGVPQNLTREYLIGFETHCSSLSLSLDYWIELTIFKSDKNSCFHFMSYLEKHELTRSCFNDYVHQGSKIQIYNNLAALTLSKAIRYSRYDMDKSMNEARKFLNSSEKVRMTVYKSIILTRAFLLFYGGYITKALSFVSKAYEYINKTGDGRNLLVVATLSLAQINFIKKNYQKALYLYKKCLELNKNLPTKARLGMAYCFFNLHKYELAQACFQRIINLDYNCVEAYIGLAVISDKDERHEEYFKYLTIAYQKNKKHPLVLLHLAEHFLIRGELYKTITLSLQGLKTIQTMPKFVKTYYTIRNDYEEYEGRFNNLIGQAYHSQNNYHEAARYYSLAINKGLMFNEIALAQVHVHSQNYLEAMKILEEVFKNIDSKYSKMLSECLRFMGYLKSKIPPKQKEDKGAEDYYAYSLKYHRNDFEVKIEYANILVETNKPKALKQLQYALNVQYSAGLSYKVYLLNNIGVLYMDINEYQLATKTLLKCLKQLKDVENSNEEEELRRISIELCVTFNLAISYYRQFEVQKAIGLYQQILEKNKYYIDAYLTLAYAHFMLGNSQEAIKVLNEAEAVCDQAQSKLLKSDKILTFKAYIQHMCGNSSEAKDIIKRFGKNKDIYCQVFELDLSYYAIMRRNVYLPILKDFLRPNRDFCLKYCNYDPNSSFAYMLLAIILLSDKRMTKHQGQYFFSCLKQHSCEELPSILYNMGLFLMNYDDPYASIGVLSLYRDKVKTSKVEELIALNYLLKNDFKSSLKSVKKNIIVDPSNFKHRLQLVYVTYRRCERYYEENKRYKKYINTNIYQLRRCMAFHHYFSKLNVNEYLRAVDISDLKYRIRNTCLTIKRFCEERKYYVKSYLYSYDKFLKDIENKERDEMYKYKPKIDWLNTDKELYQLLVDSDDYEERIKRYKEAKRRRALYKAKQTEMEMTNAWNEIQDKEITEYDQKKRKKGGSKKAANKQYKANKDKSDQSEDYPSPYQESLDAFLNEGDQRFYEKNYVPYPKRSKHTGHHEKKYKKKSKKRKRQRSSEEDIQEDKVMQEETVKMYGPAQQQSEDSMDLNEYLV